MQNKKIFAINLIYYICLLSVASIFVLGYLGIVTNSYLLVFLIQGVVMLAVPNKLLTILDLKKYL